MDEKHIYKPSNLRPLSIFIAFMLFLILISNWWIIEFEFVIAIAILAELLTQTGINLYKVTIIGHTIRCFDVWGKFYNVDLDSIKKVKPFGFLGFNYVRLESSSSDHTLWIPLFLKDLKGFSDEIQSKTAEDNPLRNYLVEHPAH